KKLAPYYSIYQFGRKGWVNLKKPSSADVEKAYEGLMFAVKASKKKPRLLVLDEINLAAAAGLLKINDVLKAVDEISKHTIVYMTGRFAPKKLINKADFVNEIKEIKKPKKYAARKGIEY
ncbi:cob(I)yrinic acid a,c-diamide adenosyltransferase, partial [Candidatus Woesearchaeota archaeon]|nr:cob(I)yrinic acid a,c-diamide adenosyltransferase [Candidatus Woesearchaeota archaeon]